MTTPTGPVVATASVAITPSTTTFTADLRAALQRAMTAVSNAADQMGDDIAQGVTSGVVRARLALATLGEGLEERVRSNVTLISGLTTGLLGLGGTAVKTGASLGALGLAAGNAAFALGSLLGTLSELSGIAIALPAVIGSAALVMGTLKLALQGVGEAFSAALSGDLEAITEASKDLAPAAQQLVSVVMDLDKRFDDLKKTVQQNFFAPVATQFRGFATQATALAENGLPRIATELGNIASEFLQVAQSGTFFSGLRELIDQTVSGLQRWRGVTGQVADALGNLFSVGAQFSGDLIAGIGGLVQRTAEWINTAARSGELEQRLQSALDAIATLGRVLRNVGDIFGAFWFSAQEAGASFLDVLENITGQFAEFLNSDAGIASLTGLMTTASTAASILGDVIGGLLPIFGQFVTTMAVGLTGALETVAPALRTLIVGFEEFTLNASGGIFTAIEMLARGFAGIIEAITPLLPALGQIVAILSENFAATINIVASVLGDFFEALEPFLPEIQALIGEGLEAFTDALTMLADALQPLLPTLIELGVSVLRLVVGAFTTLMEAVEPFLPLLVELASDVLELLIDHFADLLAAIEPLIPVIVELLGNGLEVLAEIMPVIVAAFTPFIPIITDTAKRLGESLAPVLPTLVEGFKKIFETLGPILPQLAQLAGDTLVTAAQLFTALLQAVLPLVPPLLQIGTEILQTLVPAFNAILQAVTPLLPVLSDLAVRVLQDALLPILQAILPVLPLLIEAFIEMLPSIVLLIPPLVDLAVAITPIIVLFADLANLILEVLLPPIEVLIIIISTRFTLAFIALGAVIDAFATGVQIAWDAIVTAIKLAWTIIKGVFDIIISLLQGDFTEAWNRFKRMIEDVWNQISGFISRTLNRIIDFITEWGGKAWNAMWEALTAIVGVFSDRGAEFVRVIGDKLTQVLLWFTGLPGLVRLAFSKAWDWLYDTGKDVIQGFINGLVDKAQELYEKLQAIIDKAKSLWDSATGWLIGSPSKWTMQRGRWVVEGFAEGLEDEQSVAVNATRDLIQATKQPFETAFPSVTPGFPAMPGGIGVPGTTGETVTSGNVITFTQGSVMVSFEGVVPSEADALMTGRAVGRGILDIIAERDARLAVRVL